MEAIVYLSYIVFVGVPIWWWRKYSNQKYLLLVIPGTVLLLTAIGVRVFDNFFQQIINLGFIELSVSTLLQVSALTSACYLMYKIS